MKLSARNVLRGTIRKIEIGAVNAQVTLAIAPDVEVVSIITAESVFPQQTAAQVLPTRKY